ncbi:C-type lectin domain family 4 member E [Conger conger]|uniref:C-type lectin domain family 4 member E n=1 Tax=Conger conger TaxID=82655 RepID=UPI002A5ABF8B|nr:C-type lectin domain family 4 member E [Conger conger]
MENTENYTSLQEFTEDTSSQGNRPILCKADDRQDVQGATCRRRQTVLLIVALLVSISANIALGVLLYNGSSSGTGSQVVVGETKATVQTYTTLPSRYSQLCRDYTDLAMNCTHPGGTVRRCLPCPHSWLQSEGRCYYFSSDKLDWEESQKSCEAMGSHLTVLHSHKQHEFVEKEARRQGGFDYHFWIGLRDRETEGVWKWVDNTTLNATYWDLSEPDNHLSGGIHGEDCAVVNAHFRSWFDVPCNFIYRWICETEALDIN